MRFGGPTLPVPPDGCEIYLILEPHSTEIIGGVHLEIIAATTAFIQMTIGGVQLCSLTTKQSLLAQLRKFFRRSPQYRMIERRGT